MMANVASDQAPSQVTATGAMRLVLVAVAMFAVSTDSYLLPGLLPGITASLGLEYRSAAQLVSAYSLVYAISIIPLALLMSAWPFRRTLAFGLGLFTAGSLVTAFAGNFVLMLVARCCCGLAVATVAPTASAAAVALNPPERRGRSLAIIMLSFSAAVAVGTPLCTLIGSWFGWRAAIAALGALAGGALAILMGAGAAWPARAQSKAGGPLFDRPIAFGLLTSYVAAIGLFCTYVFFGVVFDRALAAHAFSMSILLWVWGAFGVGGSLVAAWLSDRFGAANLVLAALVLLAVDFAFLPATSQALGSAIVSIALWGTAGLILAISLQRQLIDRAPERAAVLAACYACSLQGGVATAGLIGGALIDRIGAHNLPLLGGAFLVLAIVIQWISVLASGSRRATPASAELLKTARSSDDRSHP